MEPWIPPCTHANQQSITRCFVVSVLHMRSLIFSHLIYRLKSYSICVYNENTHKEWEIHIQFIWISTNNFTRCFTAYAREEDEKTPTTNLRSKFSFILFFFFNHRRVFFGVFYSPSIVFATLYCMNHSLLQRVFIYPNWHGLVFHLNFPYC